MATYPAPMVPVFPAGYGPQATDFDTWWYDTAGFLQNGVVLRASQASAPTTLPDTGAQTTIAYDTIAEDPYAGWSSGTHSWKPPAGYSGWYQATITVRTVTLAANVELRAVAAGPASYTLTTLMGSSSNGAGVTATFTVYLVGGQDSLAGACSLINSGSNIATSTTAGQQSTLEIVWLSQA